MDPSANISSLAGMAIQLHEAFTEFQSAGFRRDEALYLIGQIVRPVQEGPAK